MEKIAAIFGSGGHARVVASILKANRIHYLGFFDDSYRRENDEEIAGAPLIGRFKDILRFAKKVDRVYLASGNNKVRQKHFRFLRSNRFLLPAAVHPCALLEKNATVGEGSVVCMGAILCAQANVGKGCIVNTGSSLDHEAALGDFSHLAPKTVVAGRTSIGKRVFVGIHAVVADRLKIGDDVTIGAGAIVLKNVPDNTKVLGVWH